MASSFVSAIQALTTLTAPGISAISSALSANPPTSSTCDVHISTDPAYIAAESDYWALQEAQITPQCIYQPTNTQNISSAIGILVAGENYGLTGCQFAVRSGGHTPSAGWANQQDGVTVDMRYMNEVTVNSAASTVSIGAGNRWVDVYSVLDRLGLSTSGGRVADVGVAGLVTGGGISFFAGRYGFVCNNALNFELVTGVGAILNVNSSSHPDLLVALRGGTNNFGIVTRIDMKTFKQGNFWGGFYYHSIDTASQFFSAFYTFLTNPNHDPYAAVINSFSWGAATNGWFIANNLEYTADSPAQPYPAALSNFTNIPSVANTMRISNMTDFATELAGPNPRGYRQAFLTATYAAHPTMQQDFFNLANTTVESISSVANLSFSISFQPLTTTILGHSGDNGGNSLGLSATTGNIFNTLLTTKWVNPSDDATVMNASYNLFSEANAHAQQLGVLESYLYLNYADKTQKPIASYGAANVQNLRAASAKYDPLQTFQKQVPGGFKLTD